MIVHSVGVERGHNYSHIFSFQLDYLPKLSNFFCCMLAGIEEFHIHLHAL